MVIEASRLFDESGLSRVLEILPFPPPVFPLLLNYSEEKMSTKLYVGNLSFRVTSDDLHAHFSQVGSVDSANVVQDRETGRSRGFGFVEMTNADDANNAITQFNGAEYDGRAMVVNEARPRENGGGSGGGGGRGGRGGRGGSGGGGGYGGGGGGSRW